MSAASDERLVTYLLPIRRSSADRTRSAAWPPAELTAYLREVVTWGAAVLIVDGSDARSFQDAHACWAPFAHHVRPDPTLACGNGKVHGVLTGARLVRTPFTVIADDDVRWDLDGLARALAMLRGDEPEERNGGDLLIVQNHFDPQRWHARWDTARTLVNRAVGWDPPGTLVVRTAELQRGYDGDVLFENLELIRTVRARRGRIVHATDLFVRRIPPTTRHFVSQRVRHAYDELARPWRLTVWASVLPFVAIGPGRRAGDRLAALGAASVVAAEIGRRRGGGTRVFAGSCRWFAPLWLAERATCTWIAMGWRLAGGVPYAGGRLRTAAHRPAVLRRRARAALRTAGVAAADRG